jgi:hypothetical protein
MVQIREHKHKRLTRHLVATVLVCASLDFHGTGNG